MQNGPVLICFDLFCDVGKSLSTLVNELADDHVYQPSSVLPPVKTGSASMRR